MDALHPTLWRTCRILGGATRLALLRAVVDSPDQSVGHLADGLGLSLPRASQELRRLQSRGLIQARRQGLHVLYHPEADRQVAAAAPLLQAMRESFRAYPSAEDGRCQQIAAAFSHPRRLAIIRWLANGPAGARPLEEGTGMSRDALNRHMLKLVQAGVARREGRKILVADPEHPLARCLLGLARSTPAPAS